MDCETYHVGGQECPRGDAVTLHERIWACEGLYLEYLYSGDLAMARNYRAEALGLSGESACWEQSAWDWQWRGWQDRQLIVAAESARARNRRQWSEEG